MDDLKTLNLKSSDPTLKDYRVALGIWDFVNGVSGWTIIELFGTATIRSDLPGFFTALLA
ncbi:MAG: hypothetical protein R3351_04565 [Nitrospirales bacterium]|nr:hypothetical protein [Nitrospirales bacterium]